MRKLRKVLFSTPALFLYICVICFAAQQTIVSTDTLNEAWTKETANNLEKADKTGTSPIVTTDTITAEQFIVPFVDGEAALTWTDTNTTYTPAAGEYGIAPIAGVMNQILNGVASPIGSGGSFAFDTYPTYEDSAHDSGIAVNSTTLAIYSASASKWLTVGLTDSLDPTPSVDFKTDLYGYWDLDAASNPLNDLHNSNNMTNNGADDVAGGFQFIAANTDYMTAPMTTFDEAGEITLFMRFKVQNSVSSSRVAHFKYNDTGFMIASSNIGGDYIHTVAGDSTGATWGDTDPENKAEITDDTIINYVAVFSASATSKTVVRVYINGVEQTATSSTSWGNGSNVQQLWLGARNTSSNYANILVEKVSIWERELTAQECSDINTDYTYSGW